LNHYLVRGGHPLFGEVTISGAKNAAVAIIPAALMVDGVCRIEVIDTGEGIPPEQLSLIWDRYYKIKNYYKRAVTGSGLGLSIVKNILLLHGAKFGVQSEVGRGSTFWFELPEVNPSADEKEIV